ncbi:MAG: ATP-binding protein [Myxococcota bacterium]
MSNDPHYLESELNTLVGKDPKIFDFLQAGPLDGIWYWDLENPDHEWMSDRFWQVLGQDASKRQHLASEWQDLIHPDDLEMALINFHAHLADPSHPYDQVVRYKHPDGHWIWVRCRGLAVRDGSGKAVRMLGAHNDITALKEAELTLQEQTSALRAQNRSLQDFAFAASHDLQEPLRKITAFSEILVDDLGSDISDEVRYDLNVITDAAVRMRQLVEALLSLSRAGIEPLKSEYVALEPIVRRAFTEQKTAMSDVEATFEVDPLPMVTGDPAWLERLFSNLISNALKYRGPDVPHIRVAWDADRKAFGVIDNGLGVDPAHHESIFSAFKRLHARSEIAGQGLGLAVCERVVSRHDGRIWVESDLGKGAAFWFTLSGGDPTIRERTVTPEDR